MRQVMIRLQELIGRLRKEISQKTGEDPVDHVSARIKSDASMRDKCRRYHVPETTESALNSIYDAIGLRIVCAFLDDVYAVRDALREADGLEIVLEKDYIQTAKPNGYRSYHMIVRCQGCYAEIQLRTISMDTWAALEHRMKYKKHTTGDLSLITEELKRCADELASADVTLQTLRCMIAEMR